MSRGEVRSITVNRNFKGQFQFCGNSATGEESGITILNEPTQNSTINCLYNTDTCLVE